MDFNKIFLTNEQLIQLRKLKQAALADQAVVLTPENKTGLERLRDLGLAKIQSSPQAVDGSRRGKIAFLSEEGENYLAYLEHRAREKRSDRRYDLTLTLLSVVAGSALTLVVEHFQQIAHFVRTLFAFEG